MRPIEILSETAGEDVELFQLTTSVAAALFKRFGSWLKGKPLKNRASIDPIILSKLVKVEDYAEPAIKKIINTVFIRINPLIQAQAAYSAHYNMIEMNPVAKSEYDFEQSLVHEFRHALDDVKSGNNSNYTMIPPKTVSKEQQRAMNSDVVDLSALLTRAIQKKIGGRTNIKWSNFVPSPLTSYLTKEQLDGLLGMGIGREILSKNHFIITTLDSVQISYKRSMILDNNNRHAKKLKLILDGVTGRHFLVTSTSTDDVFLVLNNTLIKTYFDLQKNFQKMLSASLNVLAGWTMKPAVSRINNIFRDKAAKDYAGRQTEINARLTQCLFDIYDDLKSGKITNINALINYTRFQFDEKSIPSDLFKHGRSDRRYKRLFIRVIKLMDHLIAMREEQAKAQLGDFAYVARALELPS